MLCRNKTQVKMVFIIQPHVVKIYVYVRSQMMGVNATKNLIVDCAR